MPGTVGPVCGIAGGTGADGEERRRVLTAQLATLARRGPDSSGFLAGDRAAVGQTRLAVIDLVHGDPPLTDESGDVRVALNGEIYNYWALRTELVAGGHRFASEGDTEVIAHLAETLEPAVLAERLHGMFAFAVWDARRGRLVLGRDRLGKKPLYYWSDGRDLVFGSEIKAVLADPRVPRRLDPTAIPAYLEHGYVPTPGTFYDGIVSLPPASVLVWEGGSPRVECYWQPRADRDRTAMTTAELAGELRALLTSSVSDRLVSDVPLGAFLSGGVDSTAVVGLMAELTSTPVRTFAVGFDDPSYDEREWARLASVRFGTQHTEIVVKPDASVLMDDVLTACDQPFADSSALPQYLLAEATRRDVTVALSGDGGDEMFAGYDRFAVALALSRTSSLPTAMTAPVRRLGRAVGGGDLRGNRARVGRLLREVGLPMPDAYVDLVRLFDREQVEALIRAPAGGLHAADAAAWGAGEGLPLLSRVLDFNRRTYLLDDLLVKVDRMSMAHGLEVRSPLLDHRLVEFSLSVRPDEHLRGTARKRLFKLAVADLLPASIVHRPKRGFGVPLDAWFRGDLAQEVSLRLGSGSSRLAQHVDAGVLARLVDEHTRGQAAHGQRLWALLLVERFLEREGW
ncbi:MAG: asparagine synthase, glutamine-hydrolyzing [Frankiales bacterium]|nr:asparagine synthase, glutamine-hydrolyzing [Frankiales bacterium]